MGTEVCSAPEIWMKMSEEMLRWKAPLYAHFSRAIGEDEDLRILAANARPGQPEGAQFFASMHFLLLRGREHPLRRHYPNLNDGTHPEDEDPIPAMKDFCKKYRSELETLIRTRATNTNEIARSAILNSAFRALAAQASEPLHLIEIGPSAGLNLLWDRYRIHFKRGEDEWFTDTPDAKLVIDITLRDGKIPPLGLPPKVGTRLGLELNPVDIRNEEERDWQRALIPPDHLHRFERLEKALAVSVSDRPEIRGGDAIKLLPVAIAERPADGTVCVYHTQAVYQFSAPMKQALEDILMEAGRSRDIWRLSNEWGPDTECPILLSRYGKGSVESQQLGTCDPHGNWIEWF